MKFDVLEINQCLNKECNQKFTLDNVKLAVWLHGVIFLSQKNRPTGGDPMFPSLSVPDEKVQIFDPQGYVGLTCPKCLETNLYQGSYQDILNFKEQLQTMVSLTGSDPEDRSQKFIHDLRYYSPFGLESSIHERFDMEEFFFDGPEYDPEYFQDEFLIHTTGEMPGLWEWYCSYLGDRDTPAGSSTHIRWFKEEQLSDILKFEKSKGARIFPRYHYMTALVNKIDALQKYNCESDDFINEVRRQHEFQEEKRFEDYRKSLCENNANVTPFNPVPFENFLAEKQNPIINAPNLTGDFLEILISEPVTLIDIVNKPTESCNYLWSTIEPFEGKGYPEVFPADSDIRIKQDDLERHNEIVARVQENSTKQYVQDFLKTNLVYFLEEYEGTIQSNEFSYAHVWQLKEIYLEDLYKEVLKGLSDDALYVMKKEGKAWKIKFGETISSPLYGRGFAYIYHILSKENDYTDHYELYLAAGGGLSDPRGKGKVGTTELGGSKIEHDDVPENIYKKPEPMITQKQLNDCFDSKEKLEEEIKEAKTLRNEHKEAQLQQELDGLKKFMSQVYDFKKNKIRFEKNKDTIKVTNAVGKAIERALASLKKHDKKAAEYIAEAIDHKHLYQDSISYRPDPKKRIDWILV